MWERHISAEVLGNVQLGGEMEVGGEMERN